MLSTATITHSTQIEAAYKKLLKEALAIKALAKEQYELEWEDFGKVEAPEGMVVSESCCKDIADRLNIWCKIAEVMEEVEGLKDQVALIRSTEKKCLARGEKKDA